MVFFGSILTLSGEARLQRQRRLSAVILPLPHD
jgi:hypothetical protein